ncbi:hypothetical protein PS627_03767 [Pseudomonas fluorescens]|uniref:acyl-CoA thioesterase n=1 Tax=Pseudomonas fluorescens TaxID=294 RepID=UPI001258C22B|nr:thioesterase family protein [Pseudomonas fluorescens]CAG8870011.1 hypothetical protein PS627_03767 [Pseudomonas fluorescens]VVP99793.1 hypothetical protein PS910_03692 [Pseudomonas fluorescens]
MTDHPARHHFPHFHPILTRHHDSDLNGLIAGPAVHGFFDTAIHAYLHQQAGLDLQEGVVVGVVVSSTADFFALPAFPEVLEVGLRVTRLAGSTVQYQTALFRAGDEEACAAGKIVQVFVDRQTGMPVTLPDTLQSALTLLQQA